MSGNFQKTSRRGRRLGCRGNIEHWLTLMLYIRHMDVVWETPQTHNMHKYSLDAAIDNKECHTVPCYDTMTMPWWENGMQQANVPQVLFKPRLWGNNKHINTIHCEWGCPAGNLQGRKRSIECCNHRCTARKVNIYAGMAGKASSRPLHKRKVWWGWWLRASWGSLQKSESSRFLGCHRLWTLKIPSVLMLAGIAMT